MIDRDHPLPLTDQAELLDLSRSGLYYTPVPISDAGPRANALDRSAAHRRSVRRRPDAA